MTIRRDLRRLAGEGKARRVVGGASATGAGEPFERRGVAATSAKRALAEATAALLEPGLVVALDAGTTVAALAGLLPAGTTVVTHSMPVLRACTARDDLAVVALGGAFHPATRSFTGPAVGAGLAALAIDLAVLSATAAGEQGVCSADPWDAETKRAMAAAARRVVLVVDHSKLDARAPIRVFGLDRPDLVVVDDAAPADRLAMLRAWCREVLVVPAAVAPAPAVSG